VGSAFFALIGKWSTFEQGNGKQIESVGIGLDRRGDEMLRSLSEHCIGDEICSGFWLASAH
jgi:hypothetical protein